VSDFLTLGYQPDPMIGGPGTPFMSARECEEWASCEAGRKLLRARLRHHPNTPGKLAERERIRAALESASARTH
jgi:hypothetical protein